MKPNLLRAFVFFVLLGSVHVAIAEPRHALLIGNKKYAPQVGALKNPHKDIELIAAALARDGFSVVTKKDLTQVETNRAISEYVDRLSDAGPGAVGFFYYSGHGVSRPRDKINYLIPIDVRNLQDEAIWWKAISLDTILNEFERGAPNALHFVVFDACRNELRLPTKSPLKGFEPVADKNGMFIAYSTSPNTSSLDIGDDSGPYAQALASEFNRKGQDHLTLFQNVKERVFSATGNPQRPWENNGLLKRFYFAGPPAASDLAQEPPPEQVVAKEMVLVPAGPFEMGSTEEEVEAAYQLAKQYSPEVNKVWYEPEQPRHWVWVDAFYMDKHKVTLEEYQIFMREREKPYQELPDWTSKYANIPKHPVVGVSWEDAVGYCRWAGKQLPTEAQWEKAARGTDGRWYPWGSEAVDGKRANYCDTKCEFSWKDKNQDDGYRYLSPVGAYELGKSFYGIYDLAGNVWEWVQDWYDVEYYSKSPERNPVNDKEAQYRVVRGGSWDSDPSFLRASYRSWREPTDRLGFVGFRCVLPAAPEH